jgi:uncharacterized damage-inducible protein DinB
MVVLNQDELLRDLKAEVAGTIAIVSALDRSDEPKLNRKPDNGGWSAVQILEHLNTYNRYYIPLVTTSLPKTQLKNAAGTYKPGWLGDYFTRSMYSEVKSAKKVTNKMNALKGHRPDGELKATEVIAEFLHDQELLLKLLDEAVDRDISSVKIPITISKLLRISMGDALRFLIAHQVRHMLQLRNTLSTA